MNENLLQTESLVTKWYKAFGITHVFHDIEHTAFTEEKQAKITMSVENKLNFTSLDELRQAVFNLDFPLKKMARHTVFSDGNPSSDVMIIGEAPGQDEDEQGKPFVGQSGKLLNNMLASVGLSRDEVYISNILFWRPPGNRTPSAEEIAFCMPYVEQHVKLVKPKVLLLLGGVAVKSILNTSESISRLRGSKNTYMGINTIASFHPAYLLRSPNQKAVAFRDFILLKKTLLDK
ncbi:MAG: uracil-DNA glycosylase [Alphaproteobacteria bacterium]|nr:uracil-DNA glycosylase [Alphaproteobacteria bacterium]